MEDNDYWTVQAMQRWGGGFVNQLSNLIIHADAENLAKIKAAWPEYIAEYEALGVKLRDQRGVKPI